MSDLYFNAKGETHHLMVSPVDEKPGEITVWEAVVDNLSWTYFEAYHDLEVWELFELAIQSYLDYRVEETVELKEWRTNT